jgi:signal transduction histidine kinase
MTGRLPVRVRITLAFALVAAVALVGLGVFVHQRVEATLDAQTADAARGQVAALAALPAGRRAAAVAEMTGELFAQVRTSDGRVLASSPQVVEVQTAPGALESVTRVPRTVAGRVVLTGEPERERAVLAVRRDGRQLLLTGSSREHVEDALDGMVAQLLVGGPVALLVASAAGYVVAGVALRPVERMRRRAEDISSLSSEDRLPLPRAHDEIHELGRTLNAMLDRLDLALRRERRFVAEAGHELRTPLAMLRMELDLALSRPRSHDELVAALHSATEEVDRLSRLAESLLQLTGDGTGQDAAGEVALAGLLQRVAARFDVRARAEGRTVTATVAGDGDVTLRGDAARLDQALSNLVDNALLHGAGDVVLAARRSGDEVVVTVRDQGRMPAGLGGHAFDAFSKDGAARQQGRAGLGLAIVRAVADQHGGAVAVAQDPHGEGTVVTMTLPAAGEAPAD